MGQIKKTIWFMLTHSKVSMIAVLTLALFVLFAQVVGIPEVQHSNDKVIEISVTLNGLLSAFIGIYIGAGLLKIKQVYLWSTNSYFRHTVLASFYIITGFISLLQTWAMLINLEEFQILALAPFCIAMFSAQAVLGENYLLKIFIPTIPIILAQLSYLGFDYNLIVLCLLAATLLLIYSMYKSGVYRRSSVKQALALVTVSETQHLNPYVIKFNSYVGHFFSKIISNKKQDISWAISLPLTSIGIFTILPVLLVIGSTLLLGKGKLPILEPYSLMIMSTLIISILIESRMLLRQTRSFAHVFGGKNNVVTKQKILKSLDKNIILNCLYFILTIMVLGWLLKLEMSPQYLMIASVSIIIIGLAIYPLLLRLVWVNVSWQLVIGVSTFAALIFVVCRWLKNHNLDDMLSMEVFSFIISMTILRFIAKQLFIKSSYESLLKNR